MSKWSGCSANPSHTDELVPRQVLLETMFSEVRRASLLRRATKLCEGTRIDPHEVVQDTLFFAFRGIGTFRQVVDKDLESQILPWMNAILMNAFLSLRRSSRERPGPESFDVGDEDLHPSSDEDSLPSFRLVEREERERVRQALNGMKCDRYFILIKLRFYLGLDFDQIAESMGSTRREAYSAFYRAKLAAAEAIAPLHLYRQDA